jgi:2-polyprenyl-6-methoxyphenol hydroxylase-like FAD-dependent oxidoreductase
LERGVLVERGTELLAAHDGAGQARVELRSPQGVEEAGCGFVAGCDGPASTVRADAGIGWQGAPYAEEVVLADLEFEGGLGGERRGSEGTHVVAGRHGLVFLFPLGELATWRMLATRRAPTGPSPDFGQPGPLVATSDLERLLCEAGFGTRIASVAWSARVPLQHRLAPAFRRGRLFLADDAAHAYSPATGQGMNAGIQDATNLGWKLAFASASFGRPLDELSTLLDSYETERRPEAFRRLLLTHAVFWGEASTALLPSWLRGTAAPAAAPAVSLVLHRRRLVDEAIRTVSQLRVHYRDSPLSVDGNPAPGAPGGRATACPTSTSPSPDVRGGCTGWWPRPGCTCWRIPGAATTDLSGLGSRVTVHRLEQAPGRGVTLVRPDGYVGFRGASGDRAGLMAWLSRVAV